MENSKIGWTDHTWNPWKACHKVSEGCQHCYIGRVLRRSGVANPFAGPIRTRQATWNNPLKWNRKAKYAGEVHKVFTCSLSDFFHPDADDWRPAAWEVIRSCDALDWLILTKRPEMIKDRLPVDWGAGYANVWLGVTVELQKNLKRIQTLSQIPAQVRFVSAEPLLGLVRFGKSIAKLDWIITGCEQAHREKRTPMDFEWVCSIRDECDAAGIPLFHKQYYRGNQIETDGLIEGVVRQSYPQSCNVNILSYSGK
jgi:protein gp37|tara:strand:- start:1425 stop:2186 length:762 start_codon:yes stop_codon:yes gene_type:complete